MVLDKGVTPERPELHTFDNLIIWKIKRRMKDELTQSALYLTEKFMYLITGSKIETYESSNKRILLTSNWRRQYILDARG